MKVSGLTIKWFSAILLLICLVLPLSKCTKKADEIHGSNEIQLKDSAVREDTIYHAYDFIDIKHPSGILILLGFTWPIVLLSIRKVITRQNASLFFPILEIVACAGSAYIIYSLCTIGQIMFGAYLSFIALGLYLCTTLLDFWILISSGIKKTQP
jgi:hypothetical protein